MVNQERLFTIVSKATLVLPTCTVTLSFIVVPDYTVVLVYYCGEVILIYVVVPLKQAIVILWASESLDFMKSINVILNQFVKSQGTM